MLLLCPNIAVKLHFGKGKIPRRKPVPENKERNSRDLTLVFVVTPPLQLQETATGLQHRLQSTQTPVIVLLGSQQLPGQTNKGIRTHSQLTAALVVALRAGRWRITYPQNQ